MSRIGRLPIDIPQGVEVKIEEGNKVTVKGPKGTLEKNLPVEMEIKLEDNQIVVSRPNDLKKMKSLHGLTRSLIANMVTGVSQGYEKKLEINGVGYRAQKKGKEITFNLGFSHPVAMTDPEGIETEMEGQNIIIVKGIDKEKVGQYAAEIRELRKSVGIVFQDPDDQLFSASVFQDVSFGAMNLKLPQDEVVRLTENALKRTGIFDLKDKPTHALSFGQKKRAAIAGILVMSPEVIILDEPTAGLDPMGVSELMHLLRDICENEGTTIIMSTHDIDVVPIYSDYVYVINHGKLLTDGTPEEVFSNPTLLREHNLRLPRIAHLLEILNKCDKLNVDFSKATIGKAREEILNLIRGK